MSQGVGSRYRIFTEVYIEKIPKKILLEYHSARKTYMLTCVKSQAVKIEVCSQGGGGVKKEKIKKTSHKLKQLKGLDMIRMWIKFFTF